MIASIAGKQESRILDYDHSSRELTHRLDFDGCEAREYIELPFDVVTLNDRLAPPPTATPTACPTPIPTNTPAATSTPTPTPTATSTPASTTTPTPTASPAPLFLPLTLREDCDPTLVRADIVLVIDTSGSMAGQKLADAKAAAASFVELLDLDPDRDQVAIVRYDADAELVHERSRDRQSVKEAIAALGARQGTHVDKGLRNALEELRGRRRIEVNTPVMVLLTDGIHNGIAGAEIAAAKEVRDVGVTLYTIGLGADVDEEALIEMAGGPGRYYFAPDSRDLARIYREVACDIDCPAESFWGKR